VAVAFELRMKTSKEEKAFKGRFPQENFCESVRVRAFFCDDQRSANVAAGSDGTGKLDVFGQWQWSVPMRAVCITSHTGGAAVELKSCSFLSWRFDLLKLHFCVTFPGIVDYR
jgi:hypothetical protein